MRLIDADKTLDEINEIGGHNLCEWDTLGVKALIDRQPTVAIESDIYPLTITADRYIGTYSGGAFIAWNLDADEIPQEIYFDDCSCHEFWLDNEIVCGKGRTVAEAIVDLRNKLTGGSRNE